MLTTVVGIDIHPTSGVARRRFRFPDTVNEVAARLVATGVVLLSLTAILADVGWLTIVLAYGFVARVIAGPTFSPLARLAVALAPRVAPPRIVAGPPKRFAQLLGAIFTVAAAVATYGFDSFTAAQVLLAVLVVPASLEAFAGWCLGCAVFGWLMRVGVIPERVCERCNDIRAVGQT
jgi:hypothetical protein